MRGAKIMRKKGTIVQNIRSIGLISLIIYLFLIIMSLVTFLITPNQVILIRMLGYTIGVAGGFAVIVGVLFLFQTVISIIHHRRI